jgi:hypothetical protein
MSTPHELAQPEWDAERAAWLVGKQVLVAITHLNPDGKTVANKEQFHAMVMSAIEGHGITMVSLSGPNEGKTFTLPPITKPFLDAKPGAYRLKSTGEVVTDPAATVAWTITPQSLQS